MKTILTIGITLLTLFCGILFYNNRVLQQEIADQTSAFDQERAWYSDTLTNLQNKVTRYGDTLTEARTLILSQQSAIDAGIIRESDLKKMYLTSVQSVTRLQEQIAIINKPGEYIHPSDTPAGNCVPFPLRSFFSDKWYHLSVTAYQDHPVLDSLRSFIYPVITVGMQKDPGLKHVFQKAYPTVIYKNTNPYVSVVDVQHTTIQNPQKWYQTDLAKVGYGVAGVIIVEKVVVPLIKNAITVNQTPSPD